MRIPFLNPTTLTQGEPPVRKCGTSHPEIKICGLWVLIGWGAGGRTSAGLWGLGVFTTDCSMEESTAEEFTPGDRSSQDEAAKRRPPALQVGLRRGSAISSIRRTSMESIASSGYVIHPSVSEMHLVSLVPLPFTGRSAFEQGETFDSPTSSKSGDRAQLVWRREPDQVSQMDPRPHRGPCRTSNSAWPWPGAASGVM